MAIIDGPGEADEFIGFSVKVQSKETQNCTAGERHDMKFGAGTRLL